jgi:hypothetical protein
MDLDARLGIDIEQASDAACLRSGKILAHHAPRGQVERKITPPIRK